MKIFIAGSTGRVGEELINYLVAEEHDIVAGVRSPIRKQEGSNVSEVEFDLHWDVSKMSTVIDGVDAIYFTAGSRGKDLLQTDLYGAVKLMEAAEKRNINRFIMLSSMFSTEPNQWESSGLNRIQDYIIAKMFADEWLINNTKLDYTIIQPGPLKEVNPTGKISIDSETTGPIPISDVARTLADVLKYSSTLNKIIPIHAGSTEIEEALKNS